MYKRIFFLAVIAFAFQKSFAQSDDYRTEIGILRDHNYTIGNEYKVNCAQGQTGYSWRTFTKGYSYIIVGSSDDSDVSDIDLFLYDEDGNLLLKDTDTSRLAVLTFVPNYTVTLKVVIKNYTSASPDYASTCRFVVAFQ